MNRRDVDAGKRLAADWWADIENVAWNIKYDCDIIISCELEMERLAGELGSDAVRKEIAEGKAAEGVRILAAIMRIVDEVSGKLAHEAQVLAEEFPQWMDKAYEVEDVYEEEE